ncbi:MAG: Hsp20/alpha crystallin family protein [Candidatus Bathyarchaeia archaeon]
MSVKWRRRKRVTKEFSIKRNLRTFRIGTSKVNRKKPLLRLDISKIRGKWREPKPLIDVLNGEGEVIVVAELAGFNSEDLKINVENQRLTLSAKTFERKYHKSLNLPAKVIPNTMCTKYKNGVLEIRLKKAAKETIGRVAG